MCKTKQTVRFCTRHRGKTPIACSLEPCADVCTTVLSQLNRETGRKNAVPAQHTNRRTWLVSVQKQCTAEQVQREAEATQGHERIRQFMFAVALQTQHETSSHTYMTRLQIDPVSHWNTLQHSVSQNAVQCATTTDVISHEHPFANDW